MAETWLTTTHALTPNRYHAGYKPEMIKPLEAVVIHYTATRDFTKTLRWLTMAEAEIAEGLRKLAEKTGKPQSPAAPASAHFLIDRDGAITQLAPLEERTWHAGGATSSLFGARNVNGRTLGVELMNIGPLKGLTDDKGQSYFDAVADKKPWTASGVEAQDGSFWEPFSTPQMDALVRLLGQIYALYPSLQESRRLVGHCDVDPTRKRDPGPVMQWTNVRARLGL